MSLRYSEIDALIRRGDLRAARCQLLKVGRSPARGARAEAAPLAALYRRVRWPALALRILHPWVHPRARLRAPATPVERLEYGIALTQVGAVAEGRRVLEAIDPEAFPLARLYRASAHQCEWDYAGAIPLLREAVAQPGLEPYEGLIARVNLAAGLVAEGQLAEFAALDAQTQALALAGNNYLLLGNLASLRAQAALARADAAGARAALDEAARYLARVPTADHLFLEKWQVICRLESDSAPAHEAVRALARLRRKAQLMEHWETVRDCDLHLARFRSDAELARRVYWGTPFPGFRERAARRLVGLMDPAAPATLRWTTGPRGAAVATVDVSAGSRVGGAALKPGFALHRMLEALTIDLYRPQRLGALHAGVFPGERYHPEHSPRKLHQIFHRLRQWFAAEGLSIEIIEQSESYRLASTGPVTWIRRLAPVTAVPAILPARGRRSELRLARLRETCGATPTFSRHDVERSLSLSARSANYLINEWVKAGEVRVVGKGAYAFLP